MTGTELERMAMEAIATLTPRPAAYVAFDNGDGTITLHLYGDGKLTWPPPEAPATAQAETTLPQPPITGRKAKKR